MTHGLDTSFLIQHEVLEHPGHVSCRNKVAALLNGGDQLALCPQVIAEFLHVITDERRFTRPLPMPEALARGKAWWDAPEVLRILPREESVALFTQWMDRHRLGRKRILDTMLAATYRSAGIRSLLTSDARDFRVFNSFSLIQV